MALLGSSSSFVLYVLAFGFAALACFAGLNRALDVDDKGTRRGLVGLLAGSGGWAGTQVAFLVAPTDATKYGAYMVSLIVGLTTIGAWLYFCSAYTGRTFHRDRGYRWAAVAVYIGIVVVKLTNPVHGLYFTTAFVETPFPHLTIEHGTFHWLVTGLSYALVSVGFFMLYEQFLEADYDTRPLAVVVGVTALPVTFDVIGYATPALVDINYEPLGVAAFALGILFVYQERFLAVQTTGSVDDPIVFLDDEGYVRDANVTARETFPELRGARGEPVNDVLPWNVYEDESLDDPILEYERGGETRYFMVNESAFELGGTSVGRVLMLADVTGPERRRRELERHNEQLDDFAAAIRHELLNTLQIVRGRVNIAGEAIESGDATRAQESFEAAADTTDRMARVIDNLSMLARYGRTLETTSDVDLEETIEEAEQHYDAGGLRVRVENGGTVSADPGRLQELFESAFEFASANDASTVTVRAREGGFDITDDGNPPGDADPEAFFEYGGAVPDASAGVTLPNVRTLARVHGWTTTVDTDYREGLRIRVSGVDVRREAVAADGGPQS